MKAFKCDSCGDTVTDPYKAKLKQFYVGCIYDNGEVFPVNIKTKVKVDLCEKCFKGLKEIIGVKHAHWIINSDGYYPQCSNCMMEPRGRHMTKYCAECGAKMDNEE